jgi:hypothetical protein
MLSIFLFDIFIHLNITLHIIINYMITKYLYIKY